MEFVMQPIQRSPLSEEADGSVAPMDLLAFGTVGSLREVDEATAAALSEDPRIYEEETSVDSRR